MVLSALAVCTVQHTFCVHMQEELEAYDRHQRLLEDNLDSKTAELIQLRRAALEAAAASVQQVRKRGSRRTAFLGLLVPRPLDGKTGLVLAVAADALQLSCSSNLVLAVAEASIISSNLHRPVNACMHPRW